MQWFLKPSWCLMPCYNNPDLLVFFKKSLLFFLCFKSLFLNFTLVFLKRLSCSMLSWLSLFHCTVKAECTFWLLHLYISWSLMYIWVVCHGITQCKQSRNPENRDFCVLSIWVFCNFFEIFVDINKTKLHYSSQVLPASEMCLLIVVSGKRVLFIWDDTGCRHGHLVCLKAVLSVVIFSLFEVISFLICSTQNTNITSSSRAYSASLRHVYALGPYCITLACFSVS